MSRSSFLACAVLALVPVACGPRPAPSRTAIIGGRPADARTVPAVALLRPDGAGVLFTFCAGVRLTPTTILTAAHCSVEDGATPRAVAPLAVVVGDSQPERPDAERLAVARIDIAPGYAQGAMQRDGEGLIAPGAAHDLALWTLAAPGPASPMAQVLAPPAPAAALRDGQALTIMGFGQKDAWESPWARHDLALAETPFAARVTLTASRVVTVDGRRERRTMTHQVPGMSAWEFFAGGSGHPDTCKGDSGGGAFVTTADGQLALVGITSRGAAACGDGAVYTLVPAFLPWLQDRVPGLALRRGGS